MDLSWLEAAGRLSLSCYVVVMCGLLMAIIVRAAVGRSLLGATSQSHTHRISSSRAIDEAALVSQRGPATSEVRVSRFFFEYLGNLDSPDHEGLDHHAGPVDRRRNRQARALLDWIMEQLEQRGFPALDEQQFLEDLKEVVRREETMVSGDRVTDVLEDPPPG